MDGVSDKRITVHDFVLPRNAVRVGFTEYAAEGLTDFDSKVCMSFQKILH